MLTRHFSLSQPSRCASQDSSGAQATLVAVRSRPFFRVLRPEVQSYKEFRRFCAVDVVDHNRRK